MALQRNCSCNNNDNVQQNKMKASRKQAAAALHEINVVENTHTNTPVHRHTHGCTHAIENANERRKTGNVAYEQCKSHNACYCFITGKDMALIYTERCHCATIDAPLPPWAPWQTTINVTLERQRASFTSHCLLMDCCGVAIVCATQCSSTIYTDIE